MSVALATPPKRGRRSGAAHSKCVSLNASEDCRPERRVGKGASQARMHVHAHKHSAVPTRLHIQADAKDRVGTAHDRRFWIYSAAP